VGTTGPEILVDGVLLHVVHQNDLVLMAVAHLRGSDPQRSSTIRGPVKHHCIGTRPAGKKKEEARVSTRPLGIRGWVRRLGLDLGVRDGYLLSRSPADGETTKMTSNCGELVRCESAMCGEQEEGRRVGIEGRRRGGDDAARPTSTCTHRRRTD
jgi:hypothetical protein